MNWPLGLSANFLFKLRIWPSSRHLPLCTWPGNNRSKQSSQQQQQQQQPKVLKFYLCVHLVQGFKTTPQCLSVCTCTCTCVSFFVCVCVCVLSASHRHRRSAQFVSCCAHWNRKFSLKLGTGNWNWKCWRSGSSSSSSKFLLQFLDGSRLRDIAWISVNSVEGLQ